jgi:hypothetical protein
MKYKILYALALLGVAVFTVVQTENIKKTYEELNYEVLRNTNLLEKKIADTRYSLSEFNKYIDQVSMDIRRVERALGSVRLILGNKVDTEMLEARMSELSNEIKMLQDLLQESYEQAEAEVYRPKEVAEVVEETSLSSLSNDLFGKNDEVLDEPVTNDNPVVMVEDRVVDNSCPKSLTGGERTYFDRLISRISFRQTQDFYAYWNWKDGKVSDLTLEGTYNRRMPSIVSKWVATFDYPLDNLINCEQKFKVVVE